MRGREQVGEDCASLSHTLITHTPLTWVMAAGSGPAAVSQTSPPASTSRSRKSSHRPTGRRTRALLHLRRHPCRFPPRGSAWAPRVPPTTRAQPRGQRWRDAVTNVCSTADASHQPSRSPSHQRSRSLLRPSLPTRRLEKHPAAPTTASSYIFFSALAPRAARGDVPHADTIATRELKMLYRRIRGARRSGVLRLADCAKDDAEPPRGVRVLVQRPPASPDRAAGITLYVEASVPPGPRQPLINITRRTNLFLYYYRTKVQEL